MSDDDDWYDIADPKTKNLRPFMVWIHVIVLALMPFTKSKFWLSFYDDTPLRYYWIIFTFGVSFSAYRYCVHNPGWVKPSDNPESPNEGFDPDENNKSHFFYCNHCKQYIPLRASHCRHCQRCVMRRDHHCPFTGQCVGRDNHLSFVVWCYLEILLICPATYDTFIALFHYSDFTQHIQNYYSHEALTPPSSKIDFFISYIITFKANLFSLPFLFFDSFQVVLLAIMHTLMAFNNITTWELQRRNTISYFASYPLTSNPFNKGPIKNFLEFLKMQEEKTKWNHPTPPDLNDFLTEYRMFGVRIMSSLVSMFFY